MDITGSAIIPILVFAGCVLGLTAALLVMGNLFNPRRPGRVKRMPYESGMDPIHDTRRRFDVRFHLLAIAFLVFDVELLFLYPWAVAARPARLADAAAAVAAARQQPGVAEQPATVADQLAAAPEQELQATLSPATDAAVDALQQSKAGREFVGNRHGVFAGVMVFVALLTVGFIYDWRKGVFRWR